MVSKPPSPVLSIHSLLDPVSCLPCPSGLEFLIEYKGTGKPGITQRLGACVTRVIISLTETEKWCPGYLEGAGGNKERLVKRFRCLAIGQIKSKNLM